MKFEILGQGIRIDQRMAEFINERMQLCHERYEGRLRKVTVSLYDVNGPKSGVDKRCRITYTLAGAGQAAVEGEADTWRDAIINAVHKLEHSISKKVDRQRKLFNDRRRKSHEMLWEEYDVTEISEMAESM